jgi:hypothetical protein
VLTLPASLLRATDRTTCAVAATLPLSSSSSSRPRACVPRAAARTEFRAARPRAGGAADPWTLRASPCCRTLTLYGRSPDVAYATASPSACRLMSVSLRGGCKHARLLRRGPASRTGRRRRRGSSAARASGSRRGPAAPLCTWRDRPPHTEPDIAPCSPRRKRSPPGRNFAHARAAPLSGDLGAPTHSHLDARHAASARASVGELDRVDHEPALAVGTPPPALRPRTGPQSDDGADRARPAPCAPALIVEQPAGAGRARSLDKRSDVSLASFRGARGHDGHTKLIVGQGAVLRGHWRVSPTAAARDATKRKGHTRSSSSC